ncbi:MAG: flagellar protein FlaG [Nitrospirae bacterium]|nr:flagellar protein FlaG [Nitrospirota bacterium]
MKINNNYSPPPVPPPTERAGGGQKPEPAPVKAPEPVASVSPTYDLQLRVDKETSEITAVLVNSQTRAVIREIPAKEMRAASDVIRSLIGPLINKTA